MVAAVAYLDAPRLRRCLLAGLQRLAAEREYLNRINVFPVADGDTGNNLTQTAAAIHAALSDDTASSSVSELLSRAADGALDGAQGNSGAMLAQFFQGLASGLEQSGRIDVRALADAFELAAAQTRSAIAKPREGTLITAIDAAAAALRRSQKQDDFAQALIRMRDATHKAVQETTAQLEELRQAKVVDAGAQGFYALIDGCTDYLLHGSLRDAPELPNSTDLAFTAHEHFTADPLYRYCTECLLLGPGLDKARIRQELEAHGDSMVIAGSTARLRIHIHTDEPESIFDLMGQYGTVTRTKADDMHLQAHSLRRANRDVAIVTDSAADIPDELMQELNIHMVPLRVQFGTQSYLDKSGMSAAEFRAELQRSSDQPGTSQPTQGDLRRMFEFLGTHFRETLSVNLSSALSGTWQSARTAATHVNGSERIRVIDTRHVSVAQGLAVVRAAQLATAGLRGTRLEQAVTRECSAIQAFALVPDLDNAVRSGRLPAWVQRVAKLLRLSPILASKAAGTIGASGFLGGKRRLIERFARHVARRIGHNTPAEFAIGHGHAEKDDAALLEAELRRRLPRSRCAWRTELGAALGVHAGMSALVVALRDTTHDSDQTNEGNTG